MRSWPIIYSELFTTFFLFFVSVTTATTTPQQRSFKEIAKRYTKRTAGGIHLPIIRQESPDPLDRRGQVAAIGLGDYVDVAYSVLISVGGITTPLILDTGSSDLWVMSDACTLGCRASIPLYPQSTFRSSGLSAKLFYGDSASGTSAFGLIGKDVVDLAGITLKDQYFAAINNTNTSLGATGSAGIFGLGFPVNSVLWNEVFTQQLRESGVLPRGLSETTHHHDVKYGNRYFPNLHFHSRFPSSLPGIPAPGSQHGRRQTSTGMYSLLSSFSSLGPFLSRLVVESQLALPMFTVTLQRNTVDVGGNAGTLSIGEMPPGVSLNDLTWVPVRKYSSADGGLPAPPNSPNEAYSIAWEVMLDDVYFDGEKLPRSNLSSPTIALSALVDTGNSLIRGPADIIQLINAKLGGGRYPCSEPHTLAFRIGGKMFPVDPRDFASQVFVDDVTTCTPTLVSTDPPNQGGYLFSWSLGVPFLKSVLSSYYFGNLTYPSQDAPRIGFLSTVPDNAGDLLKTAVANAASVDKNFPGLSQPAPSGTPKAGKTNSKGVPEATGSSTGPDNAKSNSASSSRPHSHWLAPLAATICVSYWHFWPWS